jgi:hypothetical protein
VTSSFVQGYEFIHTGAARSRAVHLRLGGMASAPGVRRRTQCNEGAAGAAAVGAA